MVGSQRVVIAKRQGGPGHQYSFTVKPFASRLVQRAPARTAASKVSTATSNGVMPGSLCIRPEFTLRLPHG
jgi:hypothetical protein